MCAVIARSWLTKEVSPYLVLLMSHSCLSKTETVDIPVGLGDLKPPFTETSFHTCRLHLLLDEVDLGCKALTLLVHCLVPVNLSHESPIISRELVKGTMEGGEGGTTSHQGREEPDRECPWWVIVFIIVVLPWGIEVHDKGEISRGVIF